MVGKLRKKMMLLGLVMTMGVGVLAGCSGEQTPEGENSGEVYEIGIAQFIEHTALDSARAGFERALEESEYADKISVDYQNAQGDMSVSDTIARNFVSQEKDLLLGISTNSAQSLYNATKDIPIVITAVTDPVVAGIVESLEDTNTNVTGTSDNLDIGTQFELINKLYPEAKKIGIIYNTGEANSEVQVKQAEEASADYGLELVTAGVTGTNDVAQVLDSIIGDIDAIYVPTDNIVVSSLPLIYAKAMEREIPIFASESGQVEDGALVTEGINYESLGYQTGLMAIEILKGRAPSDLPIETSRETKLTINKNTMEKLDIEFPQEMLDRAEFIGSEKGE